MTCVRVDVIGTETRFKQFGSSITFPNRPLARAEHADRFRAFLFHRRFEFLFHHVKSLVPANRGELAFFVIFAVFHAQHRLR